tara:strand:- start:4312 stop:4959 length:648 start_codon:yes stop_codon:yes gene_type:complete
MWGSGGSNTDFASMNGAAAPMQLGPQGGFGQPQMGFGQQQMGYGQQQMGYPQQQMGFGQQQMGYGQQQPPVSELESIAMLIQAGVPIDRWLMGPNLQHFVSLVQRLMALTFMDLLKSTTLKDDGEGNLTFDFSNLPQIPSQEGVMMEANQLQASANQRVQESIMSQQQILGHAQQNMMQGFLNDAMSGEQAGGLGAAIGGMGRSFLGLPSGGGSK